MEKVSEPTNILSFFGPQDTYKVEGTDELLEATKENFKGSFEDSNKKKLKVKAKVHLNA